MPLNSSKLVILTILVFFLASCRQTKEEVYPTSTPTFAITPSPTFPLSTFTTSPQLRHTTIPTKTKDLAPTSTQTVTATTIPPNVSDFPNPQNYSWEVIATGFSRPTGIANPLDGTGRLFILEQSGLIYILRGNEILPIPFLDLQERASTRGSTVRGLLGMTFHPKYSDNGTFYVHYTQEGGNSIIASYRVSNNPDIADPNTETVLLEISYPIGEHVGGGLAFGPDSYLYISIGDGGAGGNGDEAGNAQNPETFLGSMLQMDVDNRSKPKVWAIGLRNPWRFSFDSLYGDIYIADVGENQWEEINYLPAGTPAGTNFGWNFYEGTQIYRGAPPENLKTTFPVWTYDHTLGCSITGGYVYRGLSIPEWFGIYLFGDYCTGNIWGLLQSSDGSWQSALLFTLPAYITSFGQDQTGEIYLASITGNIFKLVKK